MSADRPPPPEDLLRYRIELLEGGLAELRLELHDDYYDRAQLMNEYIPRSEHASKIAEASTATGNRLNRLMAAATIAMVLTSIASVLVAVLR